MPHAMALHAQHRLQHNHRRVQKIPPHLQWPEYEWHQLEMCALPANKIEGEVVRAWETSQDESGRRPTRPTGVVVFRRGKLPMRVGMSTEQFTQLVVYQAAAQVSLSRVGYDFDDF